MAARRFHAGDAPRRCRGITKRGVQCSFSTTSTFQDRDGYDIVAPLRHGCEFCRVHLPTLVLETPEVADVVFFFLDFETSGLDIFADHIVEFGLLCSSGECFATVCCPPTMTPGPHVHGIENDELAKGPCFEEAFTRMVQFVEWRLMLSMESDDSSEDEIPATRFKDERPSPVMVAHNGRGFDFPFLLSECQRNNLDWSLMASWMYVDTLDLVRAIDEGALGSCKKLQCLLHQTAVGDLQAHRALDR